ncbi:hypothetical protein niasHT_039455 [Heterodera trifolii]|uniref:STAS domain-containing protein n=1 Tax=Heterodera trifolii TaxID=157864 RepID=A0ABD2IN81_9BILA
MDPINMFGGARRAPMNQDEFDTKFNFLNERRNRNRRQYSLDSIVEQTDAEGGAADLCGAALCWRRAGGAAPHRSISIVTTPAVPSKRSCQQQHSANSGSGVHALSRAVGEDEARVRLCLYTHLPLIRTLKRYSLRKDAFGDARAGLALALHSTAEGLAMSFLAGLPPMMGVYTVFCATLFYMFFGTSKYSFLGTNLVICFLLRNIVERGVENLNEIQSENRYDDEHVQIAVTVTFLAAIIQSLVYLFHADFIFSFMADDQVLSGFSAGIGLRIMFTQLGNIIHFRSNRICAVDLPINDASSSASQSMPANFGSFPCVIWAYYRRLNGHRKPGGYATLQSLSSNIIQKLNTSVAEQANSAHIVETNCLPSFWECFDAINLNTLAISVACVLLLVFTRQCIGPLTRFRLRSAVSSEFLVILLAGFLSRWLNAERRWQLETVKFGNGSAFMVTVPHLSLISSRFLSQTLLLDAFALALLVHTLHMRAASALARTHKYRVYEKQELFTLSIIGIFCSFLCAFSPGHSPLRTHHGTRAGAKTTLTNLTLVLTIVPLILWASFLFEALPVCVLSCILLTAICPLFMGLIRLPLLWTVSCLDVLTFGFAALAAILFSDLCQALFYSVIFAVSTIVVRAQWPRLQQLVNVTGSGVYYAERCYYGSDLMDESGVSVIRYEAPILFHNAKHFKYSVLEAARQIKGQLLGIGIGTRTGSMKSMKSTNAGNVCSGAGPSAPTNKDSIQMKSTLLISGDIVPNYDNLIAGPSLESGSINKVLIIDFSSVPYLDAQAITIIRELFDELSEKKCRLLFASVNSTIRTWFKLCGAFEHVPKHYFFPSVHDAVLCAQQMGGFIAPSIHMSVSLNGCRDLITLSNAASNHDINLNTETSGQSSINITHPEVASLGPSAAAGSSSQFCSRPTSSPTIIGGSADLTSLHHHRTSHPTGPTSRGMSSWAKMPLKKSNS